MLRRAACLALLLAPEMMDQGAAAAGIGSDRDVDAEPRQQADGGVVDVGPQRSLGAAGEQDHVALAGAFRLVGAGQPDAAAADAADRVPRGPSPRAA